MKHTNRPRDHSSLRNWVPAQQDPSKYNSCSDTITLTAEVKGDDGDEITTAPEHPSLQKKPPRATINVVLFGEIGVGKSSVINLIAQQDVARVSSDANGCTMQSTRYDLSFDNMDFTIFDAAGLEEPQMGVNDYLKAIEKAYELIVDLDAAGGIHLLLFCMRGGRITAVAQSNYRLFCGFLCNRKVPIALVFTGLEKEVEMEDWWKRNETYITRCGIKSDGHACITAVRDDTPEGDLKYKESQRKIRELLKTCALKNDAFSLETFIWFAGVASLMRSLIKKQKAPGKKNIMRVLTQRCKLDPDTARGIVEMMEKRDVKTEDGNKDEHHNDGLDEGGKREAGTEDLSGPDGQALAEQDKARDDYHDGHLQREDSECQIESRNGGPPIQGLSQQIRSEETKDRRADELAWDAEGEDDRANLGMPERNVHGADDNLSGHHTATRQATMLRMMNYRLAKGRISNDRRGTKIAEINPFGPDVVKQRESEKDEANQRLGVR